MSKRTRKSRNQLGPNANIPKMNHLTYSSSPHAGRGMKNHAKTTRAIVQIIKIHRSRLLLPRTHAALPSKVEGAANDSPLLPARPQFLVERRRSWFYEGFGEEAAVAGGEGDSA